MAGAAKAAWTKIRIILVDLMDQENAETNKIHRRRGHLQQEVDWPVHQSMANRLTEYFKHIIRNYAVGIDVRSFPVNRIIYYIENEE